MRIFDLHADTFTKIADGNRTLCDLDLAVNTHGMKKYSGVIQQFAVWLSGDEPSPYERYSFVLNRGKAELARLRIPICLTAADIESYENGGPSALLALEGGSVIDSPERVERLFSDGIRTVSLTWNYNNALAGGALDDGALTDLGRSVIKKLGSLNMVLDLSHLNRKSFFKALECSAYAVATHTGINETVSHPRNLTREQLVAIKQKGGLVGLCLYPVFIGEDVINGFIKAVDTALSLGLENNLALGSDFDGATMSQEMKSVGDVALLYEKCRKYFGSEVTDKIFFTNSYNFYRNVLTNGDK